jgi:hypothetical protein
LAVVRGLILMRWFIAVKSFTRVRWFTTVKSIIISRYCGACCVQASELGSLVLMTGAADEDRDAPRAGTRFEGLDGG